MAEGQDKTAKLYRMVMEQHLCPFGLKSKDLLERQGYLVEDHHLVGGQVVGSRHPQGDVGHVERVVDDQDIRRPRRGKRRVRYFLFPLLLSPPGVPKPSDRGGGGFP